MSAEQNTILKILKLLENYTKKHNNALHKYIKVHYLKYW